MPTDMVVDTNVLVHACEPSEPHCPASIEFLTSLLNCTASLCVDEGFALDEARNASLIASEYIKHLRFGTYSYEVISKLAQQGRVVEKARRPPAAVARRINQIIRNRFDRAFLGVAFNSVDKTLTSHDFTDFQVAKRATIRSELGVEVLTAPECSALHFAE